MKSPYQSRRDRHFWRTGVTDQHALAFSEIYSKKFEIDQSAGIATAGSCFAQHISRHMKAKGFSVIDYEPGLDGISDDLRKKFGYGLYSARYGNIYTPRHLLQLSLEALGKLEPEDFAWRKGGRWYDALRPSVEPEGLPSAGAVRSHRNYHLAQVRRVLSDARVFVFTFGLTEAWLNRRTGTVYPTAPGTIAGDYDPDVYEFKNFTFNEVMNDFLAFRELIRGVNQDVKFILTVSPVPLTATATEQHVLQATVHSKSVLRAVAGELYANCPDVDYFPSYELVASHVSRGFFFDANLRTVNDAGVDVVMKYFFGEHSAAEPPKFAGGADKKRAARHGWRRNKGRSAEDVVCEDALLEVFKK